MQRGNAGRTAIGRSADRAIGRSADRTIARSAGTALRRVAWLTDLHLDFCSSARIGGLLEGIREEEPDAVLLGGDISRADALGGHLRLIGESLGVPVFFVLGNHDFYLGRVESVRRRVEALIAEIPALRWLSRSDAVDLGGGLCLLGHDGWADGGYGDYASSRVQLNDHRLIADFVGLGAGERLALMESLARGAAAHLARLLPEALERHERILLLTHVPPFREATWHEGRISDPDYLPHFSSKLLGDVLLEAMAARPDRRMLVLCGHTHSPGVARILPNLTVLTGGAVYGRPRIERILSVEDIGSFFGDPSAGDASVGMDGTEAVPPH